MFAYLIGTVAEVTPEKLVLEVNRIGYNIRIPASAVSLLPPVGEEVKIYTYTSVREDAVTLFGFLRKDDLEMYRQLINVSGIGPKAGLSILSALSADEIRLAVLSQDEKAIAKAPGIGPKDGPENHSGIEGQNLAGGCFRRRRGNGAGGARCGKRFSEPGASGSGGSPHRVGILRIRGAAGSESCGARRYGCGRNC